MIVLNPQLEAFIAVAKAKSVHSAAEILFLTQTAVTQRIKLLEQKLKTPLFIRSRKGMQLTSEGEILLRYCHNLKKLEASYMQTLGAVDESYIINLTILSSSTVMKTRILSTVSDTIKLYPQLRVHFQINDLELRHLDLKAGKVDMAIVQKKHISKEVCTKTLRPERYKMLIPKAWANRDITEIISSENIVDFDPSDDITYSYLKKFNLFELARKDRHFINSPEDLSLLVENALGYTVVTEEFYKQYCKNKEVVIMNEKEYYDHEIALCWYDRGVLPEYFSKIVEVID